MSRVVVTMPSDEAERVHRKHGFLILQHPWQQLLFVFILSLAAKIAFISLIAPFLSQVDALRSHDQGLAIAKNLLAGNGYTMEFWGLEYRSFRTPLFPVYIMFVMKLFGEEIRTILLSLAVVSSLTSIFTYCIARELFNQRVAFVAALLSVADPNFIYYSGFMMTENLATPLLALSIFFLLRSYNTGKRAYGVLAGLALGFTTLCRSIYLLLPILIAIWMVLVYKNKREVIENLTAVVVTMLVVLTPWAVRNYIVHQRLVLTSTDGGFVFYAWNSPGALRGEGAIYPEFTRDRDSVPGLKDMNEVDRNSWFYKERLHTIFDDPSLYVRQVAQRVWWIWKPYPYLLQPGLANVLRTAVGFLFYIPLYVLAVLGALWSLAEWRKLSLFYLLFLYVTFPTAFIAGIIRYRMPVEPYLIILAAVGLLWIVEWYRHHAKSVPAFTPSVVAARLNPYEEGDRK